MSIYSEAPWESERTLRDKQGTGLSNKVNKGLRIRYKGILQNNV